MYKKITVLLVIVVVIILSGITLGIFYSHLPGNSLPKNEQDCKIAGGQWASDQTCILSYKNTGEICTDGGQCKSGVCFPPTLTKVQKNTLINRPLENIVGTCYPEELVTGCVKQVLMGTVSKESMCLDN